MPVRHGGSSYTPPHESKLSRTWSPGFTRLTAEPISSTTPAPSCPRIAGTSVSEKAALRGSMSVWQKPVPTMRTRISKGRKSERVMRSSA